MGTLTVDFQNPPMGLPDRHRVRLRPGTERTPNPIPGGGQASSLEPPTRLRDGNPRATAFFARTVGRQFPRIVAVPQNVDPKLVQESLEERVRELEIKVDHITEASHRKNDFLANMSHELRTPLTSIIGFSDFLLTSPEGSLSPDLREYLTYILKSGEHLLLLINSILDLAKVESGKLDLSPAPVCIRDAVHEVCSTLLPQFAERRLALHSEVDVGVDRLILDPVKLKQILYNLVSNAIKFTPPGGRVDISITRDGDARLVLRVRDTGIGMAAKDIPRIFRPFEQLDGGPGKLYPGTGLGLSLTQKLVDLMEGSIGVTSEVGVGSTFIVHLPFVPVSSAFVDPPSGAFPRIRRLDPGRGREPRATKWQTGGKLVGGWSDAMALVRVEASGEGLSSMTRRAVEDPGHGLESG